MAIGDWLLNFTNAEPGACRTYSSVYRNPQGEVVDSYRQAVHFGWQLLLPADLFESVWWAENCDYMRVALAFGVASDTVRKRADQLNLPYAALCSLQEQEELEHTDKLRGDFLKSVPG